MKVLHVIPSIAPRDGGPSRAVINMCKALRWRGVSTLIATTDADGADHLNVELERVISHEGERTIFFRCEWSQAYKYSRAFSNWLNENVAHFDVVHIHAVFSHACLAAARACRRKNVPYIVRPLGSLDAWSLSQKPLRKNFFWHLGVKQMLDGAAAIHYTSAPEQKSAEQSLGLTRGVVIPLGVESDWMEIADAQASVAPPYVLVLSRLHRKKGLELLLPAFLSLIGRQQFNSWRLVLAGDGEAGYVDSLKRLVKSHGGNGNVVFAGWVEGNARKIMLKQASLLALTSYQENFGLCVVEALACGVPVLVSPQVNLAWEIEAAGAGWVTTLDSGAIEETLASSLTDAEERVRRGLAGREFVNRELLWSIVSEKLSKLYHSMG